MSIKTNITWTDATWNIARGCTKVDADCLNCYMYRDSMNGTRFNPCKVTRTKTVFNLPLKLKEPSKIFTCSLTDFFHPDCDEFRQEAWDIIRKCPQHTFQILTKRPERINDNLPVFWAEIRKRCWLGTSLGNCSTHKSLYRIVDLITTFQHKLFLSFEPLHEEISLPLITLPDDRILCFDWIIVGGESGNEGKYRPCKLEWIEHIVNKCIELDIPVFVKQLGTHLAKELNLSDRHGRNIEEFPKQLQIRQFPKF